MLAQQPARRVQLRRANAGVEREPIAAHVQRHDDLFERGVAGTLADAVDRALDLARAGLHGGERVGDGHAEIVVAVRRQHRARRRRVRPTAVNMCRMSSGSA